MSFNIPCPQCKTNLRIRDRSYLGKDFLCPDCKVNLIFVDDMQDSYKLIPATPSPDSSRSKENTKEATGKSQASNTRVTATSPEGNLKQKNQNESWFHGLISNPWTAAWLLSFAFTFLFIRVVLWPRPPAEPSPDHNVKNSNVLAENDTGNGNSIDIQRVQNQSATKNTQTLPHKMNVTGDNKNHLDQSTATNNGDSTNNKLPQGVVTQKTNKQGDEKATLPKVAGLDQTFVGPKLPDQKTPPGMQAKIIEFVEEPLPNEENLKVIKLAEALELKIERFELERAMVLQHLLIEFEPLLGIEITIKEGDELAKSKYLKQKVALKPMQKITLKELLTSIASTAGLIIHIEEDRIFLSSP